MCESSNTDSRRSKYFLAGGTYFRPVIARHQACANQSLPTASTVARLSATLLERHRPGTSRATNPNELATCRADAVALKNCVRYTAHMFCCATLSGCVVESGLRRKPVHEGQMARNKKLAKTGTSRHSANLWFMPKNEAPHHAALPTDSHRELDLRPGYAPPGLASTGPAEPDPACGFGSRNLGRTSAELQYKGYA